MELFTKFFKTLPIFCKVYSICACSQYAHTVRIQELCKLYRRSAPKSHNHSHRLFYVYDAHHIFWGKRLKIKPIACVKVCAHRFWIVVDCNNVIPQLFQGTHTLHARIVKLNPLPYADGT